jgi:hypothetical protein
MTPEDEDIAEDDDEGRRQADLEQLKRKHRHSITAVHEAGHAVAYFMTAKLMGREPADALWHVDMYHPDTALKFLSLDGRRNHFIAMTCGSRFSKEIEAARIAVAAQCPEGTLTEECDADVIAAARAAGADIADWARASVLIRMAGPVAEAKETGLSFADDDQILTILAPEYDWTGAYTDCFLAGISSNEHQTFIDNAIAYLETKFEEPDLRNALLALAKALPKEGRMEGRECWKIFSNAIETFEPWA